MKYPVLNHPPIVEAIIDIRVSPVVVISEEKIQKIMGDLSSRYQSITPLPMRNVSLTVERTRVKRLETIRGYVVQTMDGFNKGQFRTDGFTFNRLPPYTRWEEIKAEAQMLWRAYKDAFTPKQLSRIAVRFINQMRFDGDVESVNQYLTILPSIPENLEATKKSVAIQATIENVDEQIAATIIQTITHDDNIGRTTVILDIDAYSLRKFTINNDAMIWEYFEKLRNLKNDIFYKSVTEKAINYFNNDSHT
ncbi:MAG: TIGR04255 family protein [Chloroherpetonaceae bacterium]